MPVFVQGSWGILRGIGGKWVLGVLRVWGGVGIGVYWGTEGKWVLGCIGGVLRGMGGSGYRDVLGVLRGNGYWGVLEIFLWSGVSIFFSDFEQKNVNGLCNAHLDLEVFLSELASSVLTVL